MRQPIAQDGVEPFSAGLFGGEPDLFDDGQRLYVGGRAALALGRRAGGGPANGSPPIEDFDEVFALQTAYLDAFAQKRAPSLSAGAPPEAWLMDGGMPTVS